MKTLLFFVAGSIGFLACKKVQTTTPQIRPIVEAVYASGKVMPADDHKIYAQAEGVVLAQLVSEGDIVKAGQPLFRLESTSQQARLSNADAVLQQAQANLSGNSPVLREIETQIASLATHAADDSANYVRYQNLWRENATARINLDRAALAYQTSRNEWIAARQRLQRTRNQLRLDLSNARTTARINATDAANSTVRSDLDGTVFEVYRKQGEAIRRGEPLASVGRGGAYYLQLWIDEQDVSKVAVGQEVVVKMDLHRGQVFKARIRKIYPTLNAENQSVRADAEFTEAPPKLVANAAVEANVLIAKHDHALTIPKALVQNDSVLIQNAAGKPEKIRIRIGIETTDYVEVLGGLTKDSRLMLNSE
ncbi:MAG: efflux RND transporter periplasmic adaptor subunit [Cytophagaceae bacterium]|nr:efflux RND transporter periplasmic adaptor subunit [Cytophagaceae bacterium]